ncbi:MAG: hypothetical protein P4M11_15890 [Candidatus Pacebacteria bacterium]|nr:hypothetical protein [Candidatus Paceibacterota bacterium]
MTPCIASNTFPPEFREVCDELGIKEEELQPHDQQWFADPRLSPDVVKLRFERYETKRKGSP